MAYKGWMFAAPKADGQPEAQNEVGQLLVEFHIDRNARP
jgi:hypothetical protein